MCGQFMDQERGNGGYIMYMQESTHYSYTSEKGLHAGDTTLGGFIGGSRSICTEILVAALGCLPSFLSTFHAKESTSQGG